MSYTLTVIATAPTGLPYSYAFSDMGNFNEAGSAFDNPVAVLVPQGRYVHLYA